MLYALHRCSLICTGVFFEGFLDISSESKEKNLHPYNKVASQRIVQYQAGWTTGGRRTLSWLGRLLGWSSEVFWSCQSTSTSKELVKQNLGQWRCVLIIFVEMI